MHASKAFTNTYFTLLSQETANAELEKASAESHFLNNKCQNQLVNFEYKRLQDVKECLQTFITVEMAMHAKALEIFSHAYSYIDSIDVEADMEVIFNPVDLKIILCFQKNSIVFIYIYIVDFT